MLIINDVHVACSRVAGTTPATQSALRQYVRDNLAAILQANPTEHVVCNGDFFDGFQVDTGELIKAYDILVKHMETGSLTLIMGNHDASEKAGRVSSFHLLCHFLKESAAASGTHFQMIDHTDGFCRVAQNVYAVSHCMNQDLFNLEIDKAVANPIEGAYLLLHTNYKNGHAENSDHSLNLNDEQVGNLMRAGWNLVIAHEHQGYTLRGERVIVVGNQLPTSVADCIGDETKHCLRIEDGKHEFVETWNAKGNYIEVDWQELRNGTAAPDEHRFIRITGEARADQAADVVNVVAKFRQTSDALVIGNAVKVEGQAVFDEMALESTESIRAFDVLGCIFEKLEPREVEVVRSLISC